MCASRLLRCCRLILMLFLCACFKALKLPNLRCKHTVVPPPICIALLYECRRIPFNQCFISTLSNAFVFSHNASPPSVFPSVLYPSVTPPVAGQAHQGNKTKPSGFSGPALPPHRTTNQGKLPCLSPTPSAALSLPVIDLPKHFPPSRSLHSVSPFGSVSL